MKNLRNMIWEYYGYGSYGADSVVHRGLTVLWVGTDSGVCMGGDNVVCMGGDSVVHRG